MLGEIRGEVRFKEPLSFHTSLRIGGPADIFVVPQDVDDIRHALLFAEREQLSVAVIGGGNNLLVRDRGVRGVVLRLEGCLGRAEFHGEEAIGGAGVSLSALIREASALNLGGIECLVGIPATIGGALAMNAGTPDGWIGDFVSAVYFLHSDGSLGEFKPTSGTFTYRAFDAPPGAVLIGCRLRLTRRPLAEIQKDTKVRLKHKKATQPLALASAGCVWKNPAGDLADRLIEKCGLKGKRVNGAEVSSKHANFIVNRGGATAADVAQGTSLFRLDPGAVARRVEAIPEVRRADVVREFPNRIVISVEERRPFTLVHSGRLHWIDEEGRVLGASPEAVIPQVPVVSGLSDDELTSMKSAPSPKALAAIALIRALLRTGSALAAEISEIDMSRTDGPVLYTVDGVEVRLGAEDWEERLARLEGVLGQVADQDVRAVDLRFRDQVILQRRRS